MRYTSILVGIASLLNGYYSYAQGLGISVDHPNDINIAADSRVLFASDFEAGFTGWTDLSDQGTLEADPQIVHRGTNSLKITATRNVDTGGELEYTFPQTQMQVYLRFYTKFHVDTVMPHHFVKLRAMVPGFWANAGQRPPGDMAFWTGIEPGSDQTWHFYTYWHEMHSWQSWDGLPDGRDNPYYGNIFNPADQVAFQKNEWICVETMLKANTLGQYDGEQAFWINGAKVGHYRTGEPIGNWGGDKFHSWGTYFREAEAGPFEGYNWRTDEAVKLSSIALQWYQSQSQVEDAPTDYNIVYFDDVVVATEYIGCRYEPGPGVDAGVDATTIADAARDDATTTSRDASADAPPGVDALTGVDSSRDDVTTTARDASFAADVVRDSNTGQTSDTGDADQVVGVGCSCATADNNNSFGLFLFFLLVIGRSARTTALRRWFSA